MSVAKPVRAVTRQRIFVNRRCVFTVKPSLIPVLGVTMKLGVREADILPLLNLHPTKLSVGSVCELVLVVQIEILSEEVNTGFFLKVHFSENLKIADV